MKKKLTAKQVAKFQAIRARQKRTAANDNRPARSAYVDTTMTRGMLAACVAASGIGA